MIRVQAAHNTTFLIRPANKTSRPETNLRRPCVQSAESHPETTFVRVVAKFARFSCQRRATAPTRLGIDTGYAVLVKPGQHLSDRVQAPSTGRPAVTITPPLLVAVTPRMTTTGSAPA